MTRYRDHTPEERRAYQRHKNAELRARKGIPAKVPRTKPTPAILTRMGSRGVYRVAQCREIDGRMTYLGSHDTHEEAMEACATYIETGTKPAKKPHKGSKHSRTTARYTAPKLLTFPQAKPLSTAERLARTGGAAPGALATARKTLETPPHSAAPVKTPTRANSEPRPMTPELLARLKAQWNQHPA